MAGGVKTGFTTLNLLMGKLTLDISWSSKETNFKFVDIIFAFWVVSFFKSPMLQGAEESNLFYDVTLGHFYSEQDVWSFADLFNQKWMQTKSANKRRKRCGEFVITFRLTSWYLKSHAWFAQRPEEEQIRDLKVWSQKCIDDPRIERWDQMGMVILWRTSKVHVGLFGDALTQELGSRNQDQPIIAEYWRMRCNL